MNEGLEVDPNPSSFLPFFYDPYNYTKYKPLVYHLHYHLYLSKLPPTSDNSKRTVTVKRNTLYIILLYYDYDTISISIFNADTII